MKLFNRIFILISSILVAGCLFIVICAFSPSLTDSLAESLYGTQELPLAGPDEPDGNASQSDSNTPGPEGGRETGVLETIQGTQGAEPGTPDAGAGENGTEFPVIPVADQTYVAPEEESVQPPAEVSGKTGYKPVLADTEQVESVEVQTDAGETGEDLDFDTRKYPYYGMLDDDMKKIYRQIYANAQAVNQNFSPVTPISVNRLKTVFEAVYNDHPELFWLDTEYACQYLRNGDCGLISLQFNQAAENLEASRTAFDKAAERILYSAGLSDDYYEKEKSIHNALVERTEYNLAAPMNQSAFSALVNGQTVCAGYARAFQYLMQRLDIPCYYCTGYSGQNHAWNIVRLEDGYYNVDVTWDDTIPATYQYFNKSDADYASTHLRKSLSVYLPACEGGQYSNLEEEAPAIVGQESEDEMDSYSQKAVHTLESYGFTEEDVIRDIDSFFAECHDYLYNAGYGTVEFYLAMDASTIEAVAASYADKGYEGGFINKLSEEWGSLYYFYYYEAEELQDSYFVLYNYFILEEIVPDYSTQ